MRRLIALALLMWPVLAAAQDPSPPAITSIAGDSIRVSLLDGRRLEGSLQRWTRDSVALRRVAGSRTTDTVMALSHVSVVEQSVRRHTARSAFKGMGLGALAVGALAGVAAGVNMAECTGRDCSLYLFMIPMGALAGAVPGFLFGALRTTSAWDIVWRSEGAAP